MARDYRPYDEANYATGSSREEQRQQLLDRQIERQPRMPQTLVSYLINKTGAASVKGELVKGGGVDFGFIQAPSGEDMCIGIVMEAGIADGQMCPVAVGGRAQVLTTAGATRGWVLYSSATVAGQADSSATVPATTTHFREIGHALETKVGAGLVWAQLHFN